MSKPEVYRKPGVREVWFWQESRPSLHALRGEAYEPIAQSEVLVGIDLEQLLEFVGIKPMTKAVRAYRQALQDA